MLRLNFANGDLIKEYIKNSEEPGLHLILEEMGVAYLLLSYYAVTQTFGITKIHDLDEGQKIEAYWKIKKMIGSFSKQISAWTMSTDNETIRLLNCLGFVYKTEKSGYNEYVLNGSNHNSSDNRRGIGVN